MTFRRAKPDLPACRAKKNLMSLMDVPGKWIDRVRQDRSLDKLIVDLDSSVNETYGRRERSSSAAPLAGVRCSALFGFLSQSELCY